MKKKLSQKIPGRWSLIRCAAVAVCLPLFTFSVTPVQAAERQVLPGHIPPAVAGLHLQPTGVLPTSQRLKLAIGLPLRNNEALTNSLQQIYDPASPNYHHYLTPAQFTEQFGPTEQDYQAVIAFAKANGLTVTGTHHNRVLLDVDGSVADVQKAFHVTMRVYQHPTENRTFYAPDVEPSFDLAAPVLYISGLDNYTLPRPANLKLKSPAEIIAAAGTGSGPLGSYMGKDFRAAYVPGTSLAGSGQTVGLVQFFSGFYSNDIAYYKTKAGLPDVPVQAILLNGYDGGPGIANDEVSLDIEMVISMATNLSQVLVYEGENTDDILNQMAVDDLANQLSASWTYPIDSTTTLIFQEFAAQGQSFFNASGDSDAYTGAIPTPADNPNITIVGGTTLTTGAGGTWKSETVWNWGIEIGPSDDGVGSSGGISTVHVIPKWQRGISMTVNRGSTVYRNIPDVALTGDNVWVAYGNGASGIFGGTSCATPLWGGFTALINQQGAMSGQPSVGFINPAIYAIGKGANYNACFHDITTGNNTWSGSPNKFFAVKGYDLCTGWGTPAGTNLINALVPLPDPLQITPGVGFTNNFSVGSPSGGAQNFSLTNIGASALTWSLVNTSLWLNVSPTNGPLPAQGQAAVAVSLNSSTTANLPVGSYAATLFFTNQNSGVVQTRLFTLEVLPLVSNGGFETGDFTDWTLSGNATNMFVTGSPIFVYDGNYSAGLGAIGSLGYLSQTVPTVSGQSYVLSFWLENANGGLPNEFNVSWNGNIIYDQTNLPPFNWTNLQFTNTATGTSSTIQFGFRNDPQFFGLDDVSLTPTATVAPPAFQMLTLTGNTFAFSWNAVTGTVYQLQYKTNLLQTNWINLGGAITAADVTVSTNDVIGPDPQRFYRLLVSP